MPSMTPMSAWVSPTRTGISTAALPVYRIVSPGVYECERNTTDMRARWYNTSTNSTRELYNMNATMLADHFFIKTMPVLSSPNITKDPAGWGEARNFTVNVTDEDLDNVSIQLYARCVSTVFGSCPGIYSDSDWHFENEQTLTSPINATAYISLGSNFYGVGCPTRGNWSYRFNATDIPHDYKDATQPANFSVERDDVIFEPFAGYNNPMAWRNGTNSTLLSVRVYDNDSGEYAGSGNATVWVTKNASNPVSWDVGKFIGINGSGYINYNFLDEGEMPMHECNYTVGRHNWTAGVGGISEDICYKTANSSIYNLTMWGELRPRVTYPTGLKGFLVGDQINITGYVEDDCSYRTGLGIEGVDLDPASPSQRYMIRGESGTPTRYCTANWQEGSGYYNCTWDSTSQLRINWNITMSVNKTYYAPNSTMEGRAFHLGTAPLVSTPTVQPASEGWGYRFTFNVYFTDSDNDVNNVSLWKSFNNATWDFVNSTQIASSGITLTFYQRFTCSDSQQTPGRLNYFKFNTTDPFNYTSETTSSTFNVTEDSVTLTLNNSASTDTVRRMGSNNALLKYRIKDDDYSQSGNATYPSGVAALVWITSNGTAYSNVKTCTSSSGHCEVNYDPNCSTSLAGVQRWKGGTNDTCYEYENSTNRSLEVIGQLNVSIVNPVANIILNRNTTVAFNASVYDECNLGINDSNVYWFNESMSLLATGHNATWLVPYNYPLGSGKTINASTNRTSYDGKSNATTIYIYGWAEPDAMSPAEATVYIAGGSKTIKCHVRDTNTHENLVGYNVSLYVNGAYQGSELTVGDSGNEGNASFMFSTNRPAGYYNITCSIGSDNVMYYNVSTANITHEIRVSRPLIIDQIVRVPSNGIIYRNDSFSPYHVNVTVHIKDAELSGEGADNATVLFYNHSQEYIGNCTTNVSGWCNESVAWNPEDTIAPNYYNIYMNATKPYTNENSTTNSTSIDVWGRYLANISKPDEGSLYGKGALIPFNASIRDEDWNWFMGTMNVYWYNDTNDYIYMTVSGELSTFDSSSQDPGFRNFTARTQLGLAHYYSENDSVTVQMTGWSIASWEYPPHLSAVRYPYEFQRVCRVIDYISMTGVPNYPVNMSYWNATSGQWVYNGTYVTNASGHVNASWTPWDKGNVTFNCTIGNNATLQYTAKEGNESAAAIIWVRDEVPPNITGVTILPNASIEAYLNTTNISANVTDDYMVWDVWARLGLPNGSYENKSMSNITLTTYRVVYPPKLNGTYNVTIYAKDKGPEYNINSSGPYYFTVWGKANGRVGQNATVYAGGITQINPFVFNLTINFTNNGPPHAYEANVSIYDRSSPTSNVSTGYVTYNETSHYCGNMTNGSLCQWTVLITVLAATPPTGIYVYGNATWMEPDRTNASYANYTYVIVASNPVIEILESGINRTTPHDKVTYVDNLTVYSGGNDRITNIQLGNLGGNFDLNCYDCGLTIVPNSQGDLAAGYNFTSDIWVTIPKGKPPGNYWTYITVNSTNAGSDIYLMNLTVPLNSSWLRTPSSFPVIIAQPNANGLVGRFNVTNDGNVKIDFMSVKREAAGPLVAVNPEGFSVDTMSTREINITYTIPIGYPNGLYYGVIAIRNDTLPADPVEQTISFWLNVTDLAPNISSYSVEPRNFEAGFETVIINATITDNIAVDKGWTEIERPGEYVSYSSSQTMMHNATAPDDGFNYTEGINSTGTMQQFNVTVYNWNADTFIYVNITVNGLLITGNHSIENGTNFTIDAVAAGANLSLPANHDINITIYNSAGDQLEASYTSWLSYRILHGQLIKTMMDRNVSFFNTTYWTNVTGYHKLRICANDTSARTACTADISLLAAGNTSIIVTPNATVINVTNITTIAGQSFGVAFNVSNAGYARAYNVIANVSYLAGWSAVPEGFYFGTLYRTNVSSNLTVITVPPSTVPGEYNAYITANWTNLNASNLGTNLTAIIFNVSANPMIDLQDRIPPSGEEVISAGSERNITFNITSIGNVNATNITFSCSSGIVCMNFSPVFSTALIPVMESNATQLVNVSVSIAWNFPAGPYNGTITATGDGTSDSSPIYVTIPANVSWSMEPNNITREVLQGTSGFSA